MPKYPKIRELTFDNDEVLKGDVMVEEKLAGTPFTAVVRRDGTVQFDTADVYPVRLTLKNFGKIVGRERRSPLVMYAMYSPSNYEHDAVLTVFDVFGQNHWLEPEEKIEFCLGHGFKCVNTLWFDDGKLLTIKVINELLDKVTGEGIVIKNTETHRMAKVCPQV